MGGCHCFRGFYFVIFIQIWTFSYPVFAINQLKKSKSHVLSEDVSEQQLLPADSYALEDFFWTGSGDGPPPPAPRGGWPSSSVATTTLLHTIFLDPPGNMRPPTSSEEDCVSECPISPFDGSGISPTRPGGMGRAPPDQRYWLLTVLQAPAAPLPPNLDARLAKLYKKAFLRQQEEHLGIKTTPSSGLRRNQHSNIKYGKNSNKTEGYRNTSKNDVQESNFRIPTQSYDIYTTEFDTTAPGSEEFNYSEESSTSIVEEADEPPDVPFEYVTNYFNTSPSSVLRVKRLVKDLEKKLSNTSTSNSSLRSLANTSEVVKRQILSDNGQPEVEVFVHNVTREGSEELKVVYWVSVGGRPVPALTAARDMRYLADAEVVAELGYPVTTKAEPYLKSPEPLNGVVRATNMQETWLIVGATVLVAIILLALVALLACRLSGRRKSSGTSRVLRDGRKPSIDSKGVQYPSEGMGKDNLAYNMRDEKDGKLIGVLCPSKQRSTLPSEERYTSPTRRYVRGPHYPLNRVSSAESSASTSSGSDLSQMNATLRQRQKLFEQQMHNEYAIVNKKNKTKHRRIRSKKVGIASYTPRAGSPMDIVGDGTLQRFLVSDPPSPAPSSDTSCDSIVVRKPVGPVSPTSYLSMPSVKSFPRNNAVEPLSKVLEPLSVRHLDMDSPVHQVRPNPSQSSNTKTNQQDETLQPSGSSNPRPTSGHGTGRGVRDTPRVSPHLVRLGSMDKDPGVVGPLVWDLHRQRIQDQTDPKKKTMDAAGGANVSRMRQRFNELVDDAFSIFGSGSNSPKSNISNPQHSTGDTHKTEKQPPQLLKSHSAKGSLPVAVHSAEQRPLTALPPRPPLPRHGTAWGSTNESRSTSAGANRRPIVDTAVISSDAVLPPTDPAIPLLHAIRSELNKLPGTSDA